MRVDVPLHVLDRALDGRPDVTGAARQFEAFLLRRVVRALRATVPWQRDGVEPGVSSIYDLFVEQAMAQTLADAGGIGLARLLAGRLDRTPAPHRAGPADEAGPLPTELWLQLDATGDGNGLDDGRPLAELPPPVDDPWLDGPDARRVLSTMLQGQVRAVSEETSGVAPFRSGQR